jgi:hypothetical protein
LDGSVSDFKALKDYGMPQTKSKITTENTDFQFLKQKYAGLKMRLIRNISEGKENIVSNIQS